MERGRERKVERGRERRESACARKRERQRAREIFKAGISGPAIFVACLPSKKATFGLFSRFSIGKGETEAKFKFFFIFFRKSNETNKITKLFVFIKTMKTDFETIVA